MPVLAGADHPEASRVHRAHDRAQDGHREQEELHRGADTAGQERSDRPPGWLQQGGLTVRTWRNGEHSPHVEQTKTTPPLPATILLPFLL